MATETIPLPPRVHSGDAADAASELNLLIDMLVTASTGDIEMLHEDNLNGYMMMLDERITTVCEYFNNPQEKTDG